MTTEAFQSDYLPHRYDRRCVVYTGTHDNDTTCGWLRTAPPETRARAAAYLRLHDPDGPVWGMLAQRLGQRGGPGHRAAAGPPGLGF